MKVQTNYNTVEYDRSSGPEFLANILPAVAIAVTVKKVTPFVNVSVSKTWRVFWIVFWLLVFWPFAIIAFCLAGINKSLDFTEGEFHITLTNGNRMILTGNEDYLVAFINEANSKSFLK